jgi:hypothetical protein
LQVFYLELFHLCRLIAICYNVFSFQQAEGVLHEVEVQGATRERHVPIGCAFVEPEEFFYAMTQGILL